MAANAIITQGGVHFWMSVRTQTVHILDKQRPRVYSYSTTGRGIQMRDLFSRGVISEGNTKIVSLTMRRELMTSRLAVAAIDNYTVSGNLHTYSLVVVLSIVFTHLHAFLNVAE